MRNLKKLLAVIVAICVLATFTVPAFAEGTVSPDTKTCGDIGMLVGTGAGVTAEYGATAPTRAQAAVMLLRLTGNLAAAQAYTGTDNFADADTAAWAKPLLGFLKTHPELGWVGDGTNFNPNAPVTVQEYYKVLLTGLGYAIPADYAYADTLTFAKDTAKLAMAGNVANFTVDALATATVEALKANMKTGGKTLVASLVDAGKLDAAKVKAAGLVIDLTVDGVAATASKTVKVTFNKTISSADPNNFVVTEKDDQYAVLVIDEVSVSGKVATVKLVDSLSTDTEYSITTSDIKAADGTTLAAADVKTFKYATTDAASVSFGKTVYATDGALDVVVKDANGVDISDNYTFPDDFTIESSNDAVVDSADGAIGVAGNAIVNVKLTDTDFETGNTIITVKDTLDVLTSVKMALDNGTDDPNYDKPVTSLHESDATFSVAVEADNADGDPINLDSDCGGAGSGSGDWLGTAADWDKDADYVKLTFRSSNPAVANVGTYTGVLDPVGKGTTTISVTAEYRGVKMTKTLAVEVKADPEATSIKVDTSSIKLVKVSAIKGNESIDKSVTVTILDQYGDAYKADDKTVSYEISKDDIVAGLVKKTVTPAGSLVDGEVTIDFTPGTGDTGSATLTIYYDKDDLNLKKTITVSLVDPADFAGYAYELDNGTKLDKMAEDASGYDDLHQGDPTSTFKVYEKDKNGNYLKDVSSIATLDEESTKDDSAVTTEAGLVVRAQKAGKSEKVTVMVGSAKVAVVTFSVVDSTKTLTTIKQVKNAITVDATGSIKEDLFGIGAAEPKDGGAFVGYDQYGDKIAFVENADPDLNDIDKVWTSNSDVVDTDYVAADNGTAILTLKLADKIYTITVKVDVPD